MTSPAALKPAELTAAIFAGCMIAFLGFGFAATFGVFLGPMSADLGWGRETFSLSVAIQMLIWGFAQPVAGMIADRFGTTAADIIELNDMTDPDNLSIGDELLVPAPEDDSDLYTPDTSAPPTTAAASQ